MKDHKMYQHIHNSNLIEGYDNEAADTMSLEAWDWLKKQKFLTDGSICRMQQVITNFQKDLKLEWRGAYRKIPVYIGGHEALDYWLIKDHMSAWLSRVERNINTPKHEHIEFEKIHPFVDGNGRTGRMLMWWHEIKLGQEPSLIKFEERWEYYKWFQQQ